MRKILTPVIFFVILISALIVYFNKRKSASAREEKSLKGSVVIFSNGILKSFSGNILTERTLAEQGNFSEPGTLTLQGKVLSWRKLDTAESEFLSAPLVVATFAMKSLSDLFSGNNQLEAVELKEDVNLRTKGFTITSDYARYTASDELIKAPDNVRIIGEGLWLRGNDGFTFNIATGKLDLHGKIVGSFRPKNVNE